MKSIVMPKTVQLNESVKEQLSEQVNETPATEARDSNSKTKFTAIDMWNRNRNSRSASDRIRKWNLN